MSYWDLILDVGFAAAAVRLAIPLLLGTFGEMISERSGVLNLGIEGMMLAGAFVAFLTAVATGSLWLAVLVALGAGALMGLFMAGMVVHLRVDQTVAGLGMTLALTGLVYYSYRIIFGEGSVPQIQGFTTIPIPLLADIPYLGPALFNQYALTYVGYALIPVLGFYLKNTASGLSLRTVGEDARAAAASGIDVVRTRTGAQIATGMMSALAGAYINLAVFGSFTFGMISGRGWICVALVVLGRWRPLYCALAALLFGAVDAFQLRIQSSGLTDIPFAVFVALPYVATLVAMVFSSGRASTPNDLMKPYEPEQR